MATVEFEIPARTVEFEIPDGMLDWIHGWAVNSAAP